MDYKWINGLIKTLNGLMRVTRLLPKASTRFFRSEYRISRKTISKIIFCLKFDFTTIF